MRKSFSRIQLFLLCFLISSCASTDNQLYQNSYLEGQLPSADQYVGDPQYALQTQQPDQIEISDPQQVQSTPDIAWHQFNGTCDITATDADQIIAEILLDNPDIVKKLPECLRGNRKLMFRVAMTDPNQFEYATDTLKSDANFIHRLVKADALILKFIDPELRSDEMFMERAMYLNRDAMKYATTRLTNNKPFMKRMVDLDSKNYLFASTRVREMPDIAALAFSDNGMLIAEAPEAARSSIMAVKAAMISDISAYEFAMNEARRSPTIWKLLDKKEKKEPFEISREKLTKFLRTNYLSPPKNKNLDPVISNKGKFFKENQLVSRQYITKWRGSLNYDGADVREELRLIAADSRNFHVQWKKDFKKYPDLIKKIEGFFTRHNVDQATIDSLATTELWSVKNKPLTLAFNLYLIRDSINSELGPEFCDITSLTAIAQKIRGAKGKSEWHLSVIETILDNEIRVDMSYSGGHKRYIIWDLYIDKKNKNPKIIFKVEDRYKNFFEAYEERSGGKYRSKYIVAE